MFNTPGGFPGGTSRKESACEGRRCQSNPWVGKKPWSRKMHPPPLQYSCLKNTMGRVTWGGGYSPWGHKKPDMTHTHVSNRYYTEQHIYRLSSYQKVLLRSTSSEYERFGPILVSITFSTNLSLEVIKLN